MELDWESSVLFFSTSWTQNQGMYSVMACKETERGVVSEDRQKLILRGRRVVEGILVKMVCFMSVIVGIVILLWEDLCVCDHCYLPRDTWGG